MNLRFAVSVWTLSAAWLLTAALAAQQVDPQALQQIVQLKGRFQQQLNEGRFDESLQTAEEMSRIAERALAQQPDLLAAVLSNVGQAYDVVGRAEEAERVHRRVLDLLRRSRGEDSQFYLVALNNLATCTAQQGKYAESEPLFQEALRAAERLKLPASPFVAKPLSNLGRMCVRQERFREAEKFARRALAIWLADAPPNQGEAAFCWHTLADACARQQRPAEAEVAYQRAIQASEAAWGKDHFQTSATMMELSLFLLGQNRPGDAAPWLAKALAIQERVAPDAISTAQSAFWLALVIGFDQNKAEQSERLLEKARAIAARSTPNPEFAAQLALGATGLRAARMAREKPQIATGDLTELGKLSQGIEQLLAQKEQEFGKQDPRLLAELQLAAQFRLLLRDADAAQALLERGFAILATNDPRITPADRQGMLEMRARWHVARDDKGAALADLQAAAALAEGQRWNASGTDQDRARFAAQFVDLYQRLAVLHAAANDLPAAFQATEAARGRLLANQMSLAGIDLLAGLPAAEAQQLRKRRLDAQNRLLRAETQRDRGGGGQPLAGDAARKVEAEIAAARSDFALVQREIYNRSTPYALSLRKDQKAASLAEARAWCAKEKSVLLEYLVRDEESALLVVPPDGDPRFYTLTVTPEDATALGIHPPHAWNENLPKLLAGREGLHGALTGGMEDGILKMLRDPQRALAATKQLAALAKVLLPVEVRELLRSPGLRRVAIVPDGPLADLPFECLALDASETPEYLLDVAPPLLYAPSATLLLNLAERTTSPARSVLSIAHPAYAPAAQRGLLAEFSPRAGANGRGGALPELRYSALESSWFTEVLKRAGAATDSLTQQLATEANARGKLPGRRIVHFACHGLVDRASGNQFGSLAITPGADAAANPDNDGFLTLAEIYELDLRGCELAVLSACETNLGPQQIGEGSWALSRGFLVAGARRVVATNWLVDDEASASLVSYLGNGIAKADQARTPPDYAESLRNAKRWIRGQEKWRSPHYWGPFVLLGPK